MVAADGSDADVDEPLTRLSPSPARGPVPSPFGNAAKKRYSSDDASSNRAEDEGPIVAAAPELPPPVGGSPAGAPAASLLDAASTPEEVSTLLATRILNNLICKYSKDSALVMTNLPMPGEAQSPANYMQQVTTLVDSLPLCMLIMGQKNSDVVTMYS
jgi:hypothetical protein